MKFKRFSVKNSKKQKKKTREENGMENKGITLIALVITVIVLLILAGITINSLTGGDNVMQKAQEAREETKKAKIVEDLELAYIDVYSQMPQTSIESVKIESVIEKLIKDYGYKEEELSKVVTTNLILSNTNVKLRPNKSQEINITLDNNLVTTYFALINGKYYKINFEENNFTLGEAQNSLPDKEKIITNVESGNDVITAELGENKITITGKEGKTGKATVKVSCGGVDQTIKVKVNDSIVDIGNVIINDKTLENDWQYFCEDDTSIYLIYDEYLENNMIPPAENIIIDGYRIYVDLSKEGVFRRELISYLRDVNIWENIANSVKTAIEAKGVHVDGEVEAYGGPTIQLFKIAFDQKYGEAFEVKKFNQNDDIDGVIAKADGYLYRLIEDNKYTDQITIPNDNKVFFPHNEKWKMTWGYWISSESAVGGGNVCYVDCMGLLINKVASKQDVGIRPVVKIPKSDSLKSLLNIND